MFGFISLALAGFANLRPTPTGLKDGKLQPCPDAPHCVSTQSENPKRFIDPLPYPEGQAKEALREKLLAGLGRMQRIKIIRVEKDYIYFQTTSRLVRFKDDVEVYFDDAAKRVHFRSTSRWGYYDFQVNRRRVEKLKKLCL